MAKEDYSGVPTVTPEAPSPVAFRINATPDSFGGAIARGELEAGAGAQRFGQSLNDVAVQQQEQQNAVSVDDAFNQFQQKTMNRLYGDPSNPSVPGYFSLRGADALNARAGVVSGMEEDRQAIKEVMQNRAQALAFESQSRRLNMFQQEAVGRHADQQFATYQVTTAQAAEDIKLRAIGTNPNDEDSFQHNLADLELQAEKKARAANGSPEVIQDARASAREKAYQQRGVAIAGTDPAGALAYARANQAEFKPQTFLTLENELQSKADQAGVATAISNVINGRAGGGGVQPRADAASPAMVSALVGTEGSGPNAVSHAGAAGTRQIIRGTFNQYAQPGEHFDNEQDRITVSNRLIADLEQKYPNDPARVAVAYFSGEGNVAPAGSRTPWLENKSDGINSTSQYVSKVLSRMPGGDTTPRLAAVGGVQVAGPGGPGASDGSMQPGSAMPPGSPSAPGTLPHEPQVFGAQAEMLQRAWDEGQRLFPNNPMRAKEVYDGVWAHIAKTNMLQEKYEAEQKKAQQDLVEGVGAKVIQTLRTNPGKFDPAMIWDTPGLTFEQRSRLDTMVKQHFADQTDQRDTKTYGAGFYDLFQQVHAPQGAQGRITDPSQLWSHVGPNGDLTMAGVEKLTQEIQGRRTPEGEAEGTMKKTFLEHARNEISGKSPLFPNLRDPKGDELYLKFLAQALPAYDQGRKNGISSAQLLDPDSKDYIGKSITTFKRPMAVWQRDMMEANNPDAALGPATPAAPAKPPDLSSREGIVQAYRDGRITRENAASILVQRGFAVAPSAAAPSGPGSVVPTQ